MHRHLLLTLTYLFATLTALSQSSGYPELDRMVQVWRTAQQTTFGYPASQESELAGFYQWYAASGMDVINLNNAGDPMTDDPSTLSSQLFERQVIEFFAPLYDFNLDNVWGIVTHSGTDGNNHGLYFGVNYLRNKTGMEPVLYVSDEAHYSNMRLAHLQNLDIRLVAHPICRIRGLEHTGEKHPRPTRLSQAATGRYRLACVGQRVQQYRLLPPSLARDNPQIHLGAGL